MYSLKLNICFYSQVNRNAEKIVNIFGLSLVILLSSFSSSTSSSS